MRRKRPLVVEFVGAPGAGKSFLTDKIFEEELFCDGVSFDVNCVRVYRNGTCVHLSYSKKLLGFSLFILTKPHVILASIMVVALLRPRLSQLYRLIQTVLITEWRVFMARRYSVELAVISEGIYQRFRQLFKSSGRKSQNGQLVDWSCWKQLLLYPDLVIFVDVAHDTRVKRVAIRKRRNEANSTTRAHKTINYPSRYADIDERTIGEINDAQRRKLINFMLYENVEEHTNINALIAFIQSHKVTVARSGEQA